MIGILGKVSGPADLKKLTPAELTQLAEEIRRQLVETVSQNGGHLASSLGAVELAIALHRIFNSPEDKIVWDVGHQSYAHKLLTGRRDSFSTLRQHNGLSGFPVRSESPHDAFGTGHAGTSVSAAMGMALARDLAGKEYHVVAVIGDGSLGAGMALEAVNHVGHLGTKLIVVLNDNGMSISPSVGAIARMLNKVRFSSSYEWAKRRASRTMRRLPRGEWLWRVSKWMKGRVEKILLPSFWQELGFVYLGPVDGHNIVKLEQALARARDYETRPTIVHVVTQKGRGYPQAEDDATAFHGVSPKGNGKRNTPSYSHVFGQTLLRLLEENEKVVAISAAMIGGTGLNEAAAKFPRRVFDVGICEQHAVTLAAGLATQGYVPIVAIYSTFLQRAYDQIVHDVCLQNLPVVFAIDRAGIVGDDGKTHQGAFDISYLRSIPNMVIAAPRDENELQHLLFTAVQGGQPMAVRFPRGNGEGVAMQPDLHKLPIGKGELLREGKDLAIIAIGSMLYPALAAAEKLSGEGVECAVADARFAKPLDAGLITGLATRTHRIITIEENALAGGFGSAVEELLGSSGLSPRIQCLGLPDRFIEHGSQEIIRSIFNLDADGIIRKIKESFPELFVSGPAKSSARKP
ncbi:MAG: 1-deoxy-D-xylulose-5-phosphate synthase [Dehalococcoidales bacterium]|nr:1-deoxy-D-xylulose-5-phosphate synthase [Dehalococcoidales bacterium]